MNNRYKHLINGCSDFIIEGNTVLDIADVIGILNDFYKYHIKDIVIKIIISVHIVHDETQDLKYSTNYNYCFIGIHNRIQDVEYDNHVHFVIFTYSFDHDTDQIVILNDLKYIKIIEEIMNLIRIVLFSISTILTTVTIKTTTRK